MTTSWDMAKQLSKQASK